MIKKGLQPLKYKWKNLKVGDRVKLTPALIDYLHDGVETIDKDVVIERLSNNYEWHVEEIVDGNTMIIHSNGMGIAIKEADLVIKINR